MELAKVDHDIREISFSTRKKKKKPGFSLSLMCMFPESNETKFWSHSLHLQNSGTLQTRTDERTTPLKWILAIFKYRNEYQTVRPQKVDEKNGVICLISIFLSWVMVLKFPKIVHFCKFVLTSARNINILKQFISIDLKDLVMLFQKIVFFMGVIKR